MVIRGLGSNKFSVKNDGTFLGPFDAQMLDDDRIKVILNAA